MSASQWIYVKRPIDIAEAPWLVMPFLYGTNIDLQAYMFLVLLLDFVYSAILPHREQKLHIHGRSQR